MTHQMIAFALGMLPILAFGLAFAIHVVRESRRIDRGESPLGLGRKAPMAGVYTDQSTGRMDQRKEHE